MKRAGPLRKKKTQRGRGAWWRPQPRHGHSTQNPTAKGHTIFRKAGYKERQREVSF